MQLIGLYRGTRRALGDKLIPSGIDKRPCQEAQVNALGISGDEQVDKRFHGGPERALHQFSLASYQRIIQRFPLLHQRAIPGALGENLCATEMQENNVFIGDIYQLGSCRLQVSAPRIPCWKIDSKLRQPDLHRFIRQQGLSGWYFRVLQTGSIKLGDSITLLERPNPQLSIAHFLQHTLSQPYDAEFITLVQQAEGLDADWRRRICG